MLHASKVKKTIATVRFDSDLEQVLENRLIS